MRRFLLNMMGGMLGMAGVLSGEVTADTVHYPDDNRVVIKFDEPVVPLSVVENRYNKSAGPAETGMNLFDLTGCEEAYLPEGRWIDQDQLQFVCKKGVDGQTEFRVAFRPGSDKYLSGKKMPQSSFSFRCKDKPLEAVRVNSGHTGAVVCVQVQNPLTKEQLAFSHTTPAVYTFREVVDEDRHRMDSKRYGRSVRGVPTAARLRHISPNKVMELLFPERKAKDIKKEELTALTADSVVPGCVLVQAESDLPGSKEWELCMEAEEGTGLLDSTLPAVRAGALRMKVAQRLTEKGLCVQVTLNAPVLKSEVTDFFRRLEMKVGQAAAQNSDDGRSKTITLQDGKTLTLTLCEPVRRICSELSGLRSGDEAQKFYGFAPPYVQTIEMSVSGTAPMPQLLDVCLPVGTKAMLGAVNTEPERVRLSLTPVRPALAVPHKLSSPILVPANGERKLSLPVRSLMQAEVSLARLEPEQFLEYASLLNKQNYEEVDALSEAQYELARLKVLRMMGDSAVSKDSVNLAARRLRSLQRSAPNFAVLRAVLRGVNFTAPQQVAVSAAEGKGPNAGVALLDMDALAGGKARPGFYILSVRRCPTPEVQEQLRRVNAAADTFSSEQWYPVVISNLQLTTGADLIVATHLNDGTPVTEGRLLRRGSSDVELSNGVVIVPRDGRVRRSERELWYVLQSGDDYFPIAWYDRSVRLSDDNRLELVHDRGLYRPGETVHMRGVFRRVSAKGEASIPNVKTVNFTVNRPNGTRLLEKNLKVNEYGAFDIDFTLPEGDEDVTGDYRVVARSGDYRAYSYVECQVFRRDSFEVKAELSMEPVCAENYTLKVSAKDLNGTPLSGADLKLRIHHELGSDKAARADVQVRQLKLGEDGTALIKSNLPELTPQFYSCRVMVNGELSNDRQEVKRLPYVAASTYHQDFTFRFEDNDILHLRKVVAEGEQAPVLDREQKVHLRLLSYLPREEQLPNGFVIRDLVRLPLWEGDVVVPAGAVNGVPTGILERWKNFYNSLAQVNAPLPRIPMIVEISATDAAGRLMERTINLYPNLYRRYERYRPLVPTTAEYDNGQLRMKFAAPCAGRAVVMLRSVRGTRVQTPIVIKEGVNELSLPLVEGEFGQVQVCVLQPVQNEGLYNHYESYSGVVKVPNHSAALKVELKLPQQPAAPGARLTLGGRVLGPDGQPAKAQVTLLAVDAGMLSVNRFRLPDLVDSFTSLWVQNFYAGGLLYSRPDMELPSLLSGIWSGRHLDAQGRMLPYSFHIYDPFAPDAEMGMVMRGAGSGARAFYSRKAKGAVNAVMAEEDGLGVADECAEPMSMEAAPAPQALPSAVVSAAGATDSGNTAPRLRTNFIPVAVWAPSLQTDDKGDFSTEVILPDTLTTYKVFALVLGRDGRTFGNGEGEFRVSQPVMLTPGTPFFMSTGDCLRLPLTVTNGSDKDGTWVVMMEGAANLQKVRLKAGASATIYFDYTAVGEGERKLHWKAVSPSGSDAVEGIFSVRFPAPLLKEAHHLVLQEGQEALKVANLLAPELATSSRGEMKVLLSANPLLHLYGCMELVQNGAYPCTQYSATSLMVWMLYDRLAPFSPIMAQTEPAEARRCVTKGIEELLKHRCEDGGISFWYGARTSSPWTSAYVGLVLTLAREQGFDVPEEAMEALKNYLRKQLELSRLPEPKVNFSCFDRFAIGRIIGEKSVLDEALREALKQAEAMSEQSAVGRSGLQWAWWRTSHAVASLRFLAEMNSGKADVHADFLQWMRAVGHDYRHAGTWDGGWMLIALHEYLRRTPAAQCEATLTLQDGQQLTLGNGLLTLVPPAAPKLGDISSVLSPTSGTAYVTVLAKALPERTDYPGVTEKGLQLTRIYEKRGEDGVWREAREFCVGDVVRVTLTCAKTDRDLEYFVLEDYLPSCMEAINPNVPSQAAGLEWAPWSHWFDHKEYLSYRVRGFCTRWCGRDLLNMSYYARVKRAGTSVAPPAQGQLMYEPQTYGLSPNMVIISR